MGAVRGRRVREAVWGRGCAGGACGGQTASSHTWPSSLLLLLLLLLRLLV